MLASILPKPAWRAATGLLLCGALGAAAAGEAPSEARSGPRFAELVFERINEVRLARGLAPLEHDPRLEALALEHGTTMLESGRPSHDGFQGRFARVPASKLCVENVAAGFTRPHLLVEAWEAAPAHRRNLFEARVRRLGVASVGRYVTMFACS